MKIALLDSANIVAETAAKLPPAGSHQVFDKQQLLSCR